MSKYGKWIVGGLGWVLGGPIGGIIGYFVGSMFDNSSVQVNEFQNSGSRIHQTSQGDFNINLLQTIFIAPVWK